MAFALHRGPGGWLRIPAFPTPDQRINPQDAVEYVIGHLNTNLSAKLDTIEAEYADGIALVDVDAYWRAPQERYPGALNVVVVPARAVPITNSDQRQQFEVLVELIVSGSQTSSTSTKRPTEIILARTWRTYRAVYELLHKSTLSNAVGYVIVESAEPTDLALEGKSYQQRLEIALTIYTA